jgi:hypothetical protein
MDFDRTMVSELENPDDGLWAHYTLQDLLTQKTLEIFPFEVTRPNINGWQDDSDLLYRRFVNVLSGNSVQSIAVQPEFILLKAGAVTAERTADDFREQRAELLVREGATGDKYELANVANDTVMVDGRLFYSMTYTQIYDEAATEWPLVADGWLYLYFPDDFGTVRYFYTIVFLDLHEEGGSYAPLSEELMLRFLADFQPLRPDGA